MAANAAASGNAVAGLGSSSNNQPIIMREAGPAGPAGAAGVDSATPISPPGMDFDAGDLMGLINFEEFDLSDFLTIDGIGLAGLPR